MKQTVGLIVLFFSLAIPLSAQSDTEQEWPINTATLVGVGGYNLRDTYLSPGNKLNYTGWGLRVMNERMKRVKLADYNVSRQNMFNVELAFTDNPAQTASDLAMLGDYSIGYHYHFQPLPNLKILTGGAARLMGGVIYNTRNGNNPASVKADLDLNLSAQAIYTVRIKEYPLTIRYQFETPFAGVLFSPKMGQSYYEIFDLGNHSGVVKFNSFHNKFAMRNYLTVDFPVWNYTIRAGYLNSYYYTDVNGLESHIISNSFMIGLVKEFVAFSGRKLKNKQKERSAFY